MAIYQQFHYILSDGTIITDQTVVNKMNKNWVATLTPEEQEEHRQAVIRQEKLRQEKIDIGNLEVDNNGYIWKDAEALRINKPSDPVWDQYFARYLSDMKIECKIVNTNI